MGLLDGKRLLITGVLTDSSIAFHAIVLMLPLLFSRDVYSYAFYGRIVTTYRANPYGATPSDFPLNSLFPLTWPGWRSRRAPRWCSPRSGGR